MRGSEEILEYLKKESKQVKIPDGVKPEQMRRKLERYDEWKENGPAVRRSGASMKKALAAAACICVVLGGAIAVEQQGWFAKSLEQQVAADEAKNQGGTWVSDAANQEAGISQKESSTQTTYEDIYAAMHSTWEKEGWFARGMEVNEGVMPEAGTNSGIVEMPAAEESIQSSEKQLISTETADIAEDLAFGTTNVQTVGVDEGDIVKNDGRYLYQSIQIDTEDGWESAIQIVDTRDGLKELCRVGCFESIREFFVWEDLLIVIENKYQQDKFRTLQMEKSMMYSICDVAFHENYYHEITVFDLSNHVIPRKLKTFTLQGRYESARIADGYFYGFSRYYASPGDGAEDYDAYVPQVEGKRLEASEILLPEDSTGTSYLVLVSVDLKNPTEFFRTAAVVTDGDLYYVSGENIYVTDTKSAEGQEGWTSDTTSILRFGYGAGRFVLQAEGEIKGSLDDSFSLDEYNGYLRAVSTVREYRLKKLVDDRTGKEIGSSLEEERQTNALYVLSEDLEVVGSVEGLAEDELIYSARFLGDTGYFVTFRQTDPLFAVDLSDPTAPKILSELKISGFSEYLHFYGTDRLLGIGMEADEETGAQEGMKLSMFDISDPTEVKEIAKLPLSDYNYSEALYNHRAVLINSQVNLFGFEAEGSNRGNYWKDYLLFSYEDEAFVLNLKLNTKAEDGGYYTSRGTFIGDIFYLLRQDGNVESYHRKTGEKLESLDS